MIRYDVCAKLTAAVREERGKAALHHCSVETFPGLRCGGDQNVRRPGKKSRPIKSAVYFMRFFFAITTYEAVKVLHTPPDSA